MSPEKILARAQQVLSTKIPAGLKFDEAKCVSRIRVLEAFCTTEDSLLEHFLNDVSEHSGRYFTAEAVADPKQPSATSGAPSEPASDRATIGSNPPIDRLKLSALFEGLSESDLQRLLGEVKSSVPKSSSRDAGMFGSRNE